MKTIALILLGLSSPAWAFDFYIGVHDSGGKEFYLAGSELTPREDLTRTNLYMSDFVIVDVQTLQRVSSEVAISHAWNPDYICNLRGYRGGGRLSRQKMDPNAVAWSLTGRSVRQLTANTLPDYEEQQGFVKLFSINCYH